VPWFATFCATQNDFSEQWTAGGIDLPGYLVILETEMQKKKNGPLITQMNTDETEKI
jgi:hypothetical protein